MNEVSAGGACLDCVLVNCLSWSCWPDAWPAGQEDVPMFDLGPF